MEDEAADRIDTLTEQAKADEEAYQREAALVDELNERATRLRAEITRLTTALDAAVREREEAEQQRVYAEAHRRDALDEADRLRSENTRLTEQVRAASDAFKVAHPYCLKWRTDIPSIDGPFNRGWTAHEECGAGQHVYAMFMGARFPPLVAALSIYDEGAAG